MAIVLAGYELTAALAPIRSPARGRRVVESGSYLWLRFPSFFFFLFFLFLPFFQSCPTTLNPSSLPSLLANTIRFALVTLILQKSIIDVAVFP